MTGTPLQNNLGELHALLAFAMPHIFARADSVPAFGAPDGGDAVAAVRALLEPFVLRRLKADVMAQLPPKQVLTVHVEMTPAQATAYERVRAHRARACGCVWMCVLCARVPTCVCLRACQVRAGAMARARAAAAAAASSDLIGALAADGGGCTTAFMELRKAASHRIMLQSPAYAEQVGARARARAA